MKQTKIVATIIILQMMLGFLHLSPLQMSDEMNQEMNTSENNHDPTFESIDKLHVMDDSFELPRNFTSLDFSITNSSEYIFAGYFSGTVVLNSTHSLASNTTSEDLLLLQTDFNGTITKYFHEGGKGDDRIKGIDIDPYGNLYLAGYLGGNTSLSMADGSTNIHWTEDREGMILKLDSAFDILWSNNVTTHGNGNEISDVDWHTDDTVAVVGDCEGTKVNGVVTSISFGTVVTYKRCGNFYTSNASITVGSGVAAGGTGTNLFVGKLNSTGKWQWAQKTEGCRSGGSSGCAGWTYRAIYLNAESTNIWHDSNGDIIAQGRSWQSSTTNPNYWCGSTNSQRGLVFGTWAINNACTPGIFAARLSGSGSVDHIININGAWGSSASDTGYSGDSVSEGNRLTFYTKASRNLEQGTPQSGSNVCSSTSNPSSDINWLNESLCGKDGYSIFSGTGSVSSIELTSGNSSQPQLITAFLGTGTVTLGSKDLVLTSANTPVVAQINTSNASSASTGYGWGWSIILSSYAGYSLESLEVSQNGDIHVLMRHSRDVLLRVTEDSDGDGVGRYSDMFPNDNTQWYDYDDDGFGDQQTGNNPDGCITQWGNSTVDLLGCPDYDGDGWSDSRDRFPGQKSQWNDTDWDGYGDNQSGFRPDSCVDVTGTSNRNITGALNGNGSIYGCPDSDYDGFSNNLDDCPQVYGDSTRGVENATNVTRMGCGDADRDGYADSTDACPLQYGVSWADRFACPDLDNDGISDLNDPRPSNSTTDLEDWDSDGVRDSRSWTIQNHTFWVNGTDVFPDDHTEWNDSDGDGVGDNSDAFRFNPNETSDSDGDGIGDQADDCPNVNGTSTEGNHLGCQDSDQDGWADVEDRFPYDMTQWSDYDSDGYGDNWNDSSLNISRAGTDGQWVRNATTPDDWWDVYGTSTIDSYGRPDADRDGYSNSADDCNQQPGSSSIDRTGCSDTDGDGISDLNDPYQYDPSGNETDWDGDGISDFRPQHNLSGSDVLPDLITQAIDSDGDGYGDNNSPGAEEPDWNPTDPSQWVDGDLDGFGDNTTGANGDDCPGEYGNSTADRKGCLDSDGDGWSDPDKFWTVLNNADSHPSDSTQWEDKDGDGFGDNASGINPDRCASYGLSELRVNPTSGLNESWYGCADTDRDLYADVGDPCPFESGMSWADRLACPDADGDGISDANDPAPQEPANDLDDWDGDGYADHGVEIIDEFPANPTQWQDRDEDGWGDNNSLGATQVDVFPDDPFRWSDQDGDGYSDQVVEGGDDCPLQAGNSTDGELGCSDRDGDGWSDSTDDFVNNPLEWRNSDEDALGDNTDDCPTETGDSSLIRLGCPDVDRDGLPEPEDKCPTLPGASADGCPDSDLDGISDTLDDFPLDATQWRDADADGMGENLTGNNPDPYPDDTDNDGYNNSVDLFIMNPTQWEDTDSDGYGDNWGDGRLNQTRNPDWPGIYIVNATQSDAFPTDPTQWSDADADGWGDVPGSSTSDDCPSQPGNSVMTMNGCPDMDGDGIPDILDPDADGDGIYNTWEYQMDPMTDPFNASDSPSDNDGDGIPDIFDEDDDDDGFPDEVEIDRGSDPFDSASNPLEEYGGGTFYVPGEGFSSQYSPDGIELSFGAFLDTISSEFLAPLLIAPITVYLLLSKRRRYKSMKSDIEECRDLTELEEYESEIDLCIARNRVKITHALLLRNILERQQDLFRGHTTEGPQAVANEVGKVLPQIPKVAAAGNGEPPPMSARGVLGEDGYEYLEWPAGSKTQWFRSIGTGEGWSRWK